MQHHTIHRSHLDRLYVYRNDVNNSMMKYTSTQREGKKVLLKWQVHLLVTRFQIDTLVEYQYNQLKMLTTLI